MTMLKLFTKFLTCMMAVLLWTAGAQAQLAIKYKFAVSSGTYTSISGTGTNIPAMAADNNQQNLTMLPGFTVNGTTYTNARVSSNGWLILYGGTAPTTTTESSILSTSVTNGAVTFAPMNADLNSQTGTAFYYQTIGDENIFEWKDYKRFSGTGDQLNFQIRLNTVTGAITFVYGTCTPGTGTSYFNVGWKTNAATGNNWATDINNLMLNVTGSPNSCNWSDVVTGNANNSTVYLNSANSGVSPSSGLTYTWTPQSNPDPVRAFAAVSGITGSSATLSWTAPTGATQYNVRYRQVGSCAWTNFAGNPVSSATATLTGLSAGTYYQYQVQAKASGGDESIWSHIPDAAGSGSGYIATGSFQTTISCYPPTALTSTNITTTTADISWTAPGSPPSSGYQWEVRSSGVGGSGPTGLAASGSTGAGDTDYNVTGLTANTNYTLWVRSNCGSGDYSTWAGPASFKTPCDAVTNYTENWDGVTAPALPDCFYKVGTLGSVYTQTSNPSSSPNTLYIYATSLTTQPTLALRPVSNAGANTHWLRFKLRANFTPGGVLQVGYLTDPNNASTFTLLQEFTASTSSYVEYTCDPGTAPGSNQVLALRAKGSPAYSMLVDDLNWEAKPSCLAPTALTSSNITTTTADISWTPPSPAPSNGYEWEVRTSGVGGSGPTGLAASGSTVAGDTDDNVTGLTANTNYTLWVRSNCGGSGYSAWAGPASFTTSCGTTTVPYTQDFESATVPNLPPCTSQENVGTGNLWETTSSGWANGFDSKCLEYIYSSSEDADVWFYTQGIVMQSSKTYKISYKYGSASFDENLKVAYGTSPDDAAMTNAIADHFDVTTSPLTNEVTFTVPSDGIYYFGFNCYSSADQFALDVDDISITEVSTDAVDWCNLQDPPTGNITAGQNLTVYTQGYEPGVTESSGAGTGISAWIGYSSSNTDPSGGGWTWVPATFNVQAVNNDEFKADIGSNLAPGTYYYASRWQLNGGPYKYGGYSPPPGGGFWNGTTYVSGVLTVNPPPGADCSDPIIVNSYPYLASSTTCGAVDDYGTQCSGSYGGGEDLVYQLNITTTGNYQIIVEATNGGSWIGWFLKDGSNCANTSSCLTSATTSGTTASGSYNFTSAGTYYLIIDTYPSPTCSDFNITIAPPPINDDAPGAISLTVGSACGGADYSNYGATSNVLEPTGITTNTYATVWYKFTAPASGAVRVSTDYDVSGTLTDTRIALYEATDVNDYSTFTALSGDEDGGVELSGYASIAYATGLTSGATYYIQVDKYSSFTSSGTFCITVDELTSAMLATGTCADGTQSILGSNTAYVGWVNMVDIDGKLIMQVRKSTGVALSAFNTTRVNIHSGGVRQDAAGKYYLDRNYSASTAQSGPFDIKLYFLGSERADLAVVDAAAGTLANLNVTHDPGATCNIPQGHNNALLTQTSSGSANGAEWVQVTTPSFSGFFINTGNNPLPVNLLDFTARATREGMVELNWIVAEEKGMKEYVVERSTDGRNFIAIGTVSAVQKKDYALTDNRPVSAVNYYRLKMVDRDGAFKYSEVRQVVFSNGRLLSLYPNPTSGHVYVSGLEGVKDAAYVNIYNEMGMSIYSGKIGGDQLASGGIDMSKYAPGAYMIRVISDEVNTTMRFVKE